MAYWSDHRALIASWEFRSTPKRNASWRAWADIQHWSTTVFKVLWPLRSVVPPTKLTSAYRNLPEDTRCLTGEIQPNSQVSTLKSMDREQRQIW